MYGNQFGEFVCGYWGLRVKNENFWTCSLDVISPEINGGVTKCQLFSQATGQLVFSSLSDSYGWRVRAGCVDVDH